MRYMMLIYNEESAVPALGTPARDAIHEAYGRFTQDVVSSGAFLAGDALESATTATSVRVRNGKTLTTDGPFAETKEQLGGYYILNCNDLDEALKYAAQIPGAQYGSIEVRPIMEMG